MAHAHHHQHDQAFAVPSRTLKEMLQDQCWSRQQPIAMGYYNRPEQPSPYWNTAGKVYELRSGFKHCARSGTPFPGQSAACSPGTPENAQYGTYRQTVVHGHGTSSRKRRHSTTVLGSGEPFVDLTNDSRVGSGRQLKRPKASFTPGQPVISPPPPPPPKKQPHQQRAKGPPQPVRIESIFRHVELLAQSYWTTGVAAARR